MKFVQTAVGCMLLAVASVASAGFDEGYAAWERGDYRTAMAEWRPLAEQGDAVAQYNLGLMYYKGLGVPQDYKEAVKWYRLAAEQGDADAQNNLGAMYQDGSGVPQDYAEAVKWYRLAAEQGIAKAQYTLGGIYYSGQGVPQDIKKAFSWFSKSAEQGHASAQSNLGAMYFSGQGVPQDDKQAFSWFSKAAEQGDARSQFNLGVFYQEGIVVPQDDKQAFSWFSKAAEQGDVGSQYNLGAMYQEGQGVPQDINEAEKWFRLAANQRHSKAKQKLEAIEASRNSSASLDSGQADLKKITELFINIGRQVVVSEIIESSMTPEQCARVINSAKFNYENHYSDALVDFVLDKISTEELESAVNSLELERIISGEAVKTEIEQEQEDSIVTGLAKCKLLQSGYRYIPPPSPFELMERLQKASENNKPKQQAVLPDLDEKSDRASNAESDQVTDNLDDLLIKLASQQWQRPPSARNGMSVEVLIEMLPDGYISNVSVTRSSGDGPFDNSAIAALRNVGRIMEIQQLDRTTFDAMYRQRRLMFRPEDLSL